MTSTAKARLHQIYLSEKEKPQYDTRSVPMPPPPPSETTTTITATGGEGGASFLVETSSQKRAGYQCALLLPGASVPLLSQVFSKKKEAEQDAAQMALSQMGKEYVVQTPVAEPVTNEEKMQALVNRIGVLFSDKTMVRYHPLKEHIRSAIRKKGERYGQIPATALAGIDSKVLSICKSLHSTGEANPIFTLALVWMAAKRCAIVICDGSGYWIKKKDPWPADVEVESLANMDTESPGEVDFKAILIPWCWKEKVSTLQIKMNPNNDYFMDVLSQHLGTKDGAAVLFSSRSISRAPHGANLYWSTPDTLPTILPSKDSDCMEEEERHLRNSDNTRMNRRAGYLVGCEVEGNAILTAVGSSWRSEGNFFCNDVTLSCYYRLILGRTPHGIYKLLRNSILLAKLPRFYSGRLQWKGPPPRSVLTEFCSQHHLTPSFSYLCGNDGAVAMSEEQIKTDTESHNGSSSYSCLAQLVYNGETKQISSDRSYRNHKDAAQSSALQLLRLLNSAEDGDSLLQDNAKVCDSSISLQDCHQKRTTDLNPNTNTFLGTPFERTKVKTSGTLVCLQYEVWLVGEGISLQLEAQKEFEFELGVDGVVAEVEAQVSCMSIGESRQIFTSLPSLGEVLAVHGDLIEEYGEHAIYGCLLRYDFSVVRYSEPPEERMESALFSPPLSKQRNRFAAKIICELGAKSLVDLGCGSGSLLESIFDHPTELQHIAGVDLSLKSLIRAGKSLEGRLLPCHDHNIKSVVIYEGSIAEADTRLCYFDVATCMEVVEHMDPEPLSKMGHVILGVFSPKTLILSTPNVEYNPILQQRTLEVKSSSSSNQSDSNSSTLNNKADMLDDTPCKFRNEDHRFEWTRVEFESWARDLATNHNYSVYFSGVGGPAEGVGYASQIAVFTRMSARPIEENSNGIPTFSVAEPTTKVGQLKDWEKLIWPTTYRDVWKFESNDSQT